MAGKVFNFARRARAPQRGQGCLDRIGQATAGFVVGLLAWVWGHLLLHPWAWVVVWALAVMLVGIAAYRGKGGYVVGFLFVVGAMCLLATTCGIRAIV